MDIHSEKRENLATLIEENDLNPGNNYSGNRFSKGTRPVIRWIKGDGLDDLVTRAAIGQATRIFGNQVDYCLCTQGLDAARVRNILEWAAQPVEWWPVNENDNRQLADFLLNAGCSIENFGYWWKWFPERVRPDAPEWIVDGDMVITGKPDWFLPWIEGKDVVRLSQDDDESPSIYGKYATLVDLELMLYSGLASLPPGCRYMPYLAEVLGQQPLSAGHNGKKDMDEQGVIAATFQKLDAQPIPLYEFPFCRAFQDYTDFGMKGDQGMIWGYHFGNSFVRVNPHFDRLEVEGKVFSKIETNLVESFTWMKNYGQWGIPGWSLPDQSVRLIVEQANVFIGERVLEVGTSRGYLAAILASNACRVTTVDHRNRGAERNLEGLAVRVVEDDFVHFINTSNHRYKLIIVDLHGNSPEAWKKYSKPLMKMVRKGSTLILNNARLGNVPPWHSETGVEWFLNQLPRKWKVEVYDDLPPGIALVRNNRKMKKSGKRTNKFLKLRDFSTLARNFIRLKRIFPIRMRYKLSRDLVRIANCELFVERYYLENNPDVQKSGIAPALHYLLFGGFEGRKPSILFDSDFYLGNYQDVLNSGINPLIHFIKYGKAEGRDQIIPAQHHQV